MFDNILNLPAYRPPPKCEWPIGSEIRKYMGQDIFWRSKKDGGFHMSKEELEPYRLLGDSKVDKILHLLKEEGRPLGPGDDLLVMAEKALDTKETLRSPAQVEMCSFLKTYQLLPSWVDEEQLKRGQDVFLAYAPAAGLALYYRSLVPGFSIPKIAAVVRSTGYLTPPSRPDQALQRLLDTGELTASCTGLGIDAILPGGFGWKAALHVRFLHAKVRHVLMSRRGKRRWDVDKLGVPINQEDMAATLLAFGENVLIGIDFVSGVQLPDTEKEDYLALWRYLGWLLGVETINDERTNKEISIADLPPLDPCGPGNNLKPNVVKNSSALLQSMIIHLMNPDETSIEIAHHLLKITDRKPPSMKLEKIPCEFYQNDLFYFRCFQCRRFIGDPLADALALPFHSSPWKRLKLRFKSSLVLSLVRVYTLSAMLIPCFRRQIIRFHTRALIKFHENWERTHKSKMAKALYRGEKASCMMVDEDSNDELETFTKTEDSFCPFAMIASPKT